MSVSRLAERMTGNSVLLEMACKNISYTTNSQTIVDNSLNVHRNALLFSRSHHRYSQPIYPRLDAFGLVRPEIPAPSLRKGHKFYFDPFAGSIPSLFFPPLFFHA